MKFSLVAAFVLIVLACPAQGSLILSLDAMPSAITAGPETGDFIVTYHADLSGDGRLDPAATLGSTCVGMGGTLIPCSPTGTFFTVYDVAGFVSAYTPLLNWFITVQPTGITPSIVCGSCLDDPTLENVTFFYTGPVVHGDGTGVSFDGFQIVSTLSNLSPGMDFSSQSTIDVGASLGNTEQNFGQIAISDPAQDAPEPSTLVLSPAGLIAVILFWRYRAKIRTNGRQS